MVTRHNLVYSIAAAQRILGIKTGLYQVEEWAFVVWVRGKNFCQFVSKKLFKKHFSDRRREEGKMIDLVIDPQNDRHFTAMGGNGIYELHANDRGVDCTCEDYKNQCRIFGSGARLCKHGYAVLGHLGFSSLSEYIERGRGSGRVDLNNVPVMLSNGARSSSQPRLRGRSVD